MWPQDPGFATALAGGVTSMQILPGSANLIGGRGVTLKNVAATTYQAMKFPDAPCGLKMACGENPKRVYGEKGGPSTRMGNVAGYRAAFIDAQRSLPQESWDAYEEAAARQWRRRRDAATWPTGHPGRRACSGDITVHIHCYRADEMATMIDLRRSSASRSAAFHHGVEAYKIADLLAAEDICGALWADWWGFKTGGLRRHPGKHRPGRPPGGTAAPSCIRTPAKASSASTRKPRR